MLIIKREVIPSLFIYMICIYGAPVVAAICRDTAAPGRRPLILRRVLRAVPLAYVIYRRGDFISTGAPTPQRLAGRLESRRCAAAGIIINETAEKPCGFFPTKSLRSAARIICPPVAANSARLSDMLINALLQDAPRIGILQMSCHLTFTPVQSAGASSRSPAAVRPSSRRIRA